MDRVLGSWGGCLSLPPVSTDALLVEEQLPAAGNSDETEVDRLVREDPRPLLSHSVEEGATHCTMTDTSDMYPLGVGKHFPVDHIERLRDLFVTHEEEEGVAGDSVIDQ